jgi:hypothetical protein
MAVSESIVFNGVTFRRYPESERRSDAVYFTPGSGDKKKGFQRLHQEVWKHHNGDIPDGYDIHHLDEDPLNNDISNLACIRRREHHQEHAVPGVFPEALKAVHAEAIELAKEWHRSDEGREWHVEHGRQAYAKREFVSRTCEHCGSEYHTKHRSVSKFCSGGCKTKSRNASGIDNEQRICEFCGSEFTCNKYVKKRFCNGKCSWGLRKRNG